MKADIGWRGAWFAWAGLHLVVGLPFNRFLIPAAPPAMNASPLQLVFATTWFVSTALAAHLPRLLEFGFLRQFHPLISARLAALAHPVGAVALFVIGGPAAAAFTVLHGAGNGLLTIAKGTLPLAIFGPAGYGLGQSVLGAPSRLLQAGSPLVFGLIIDGYGAAAALILSKF